MRTRSPSGWSTSIASALTAVTTPLANWASTFPRAKSCGVQPRVSLNEGSLRERVRCSSLIDWPGYPRRSRELQRTVCLGWRTGGKIEPRKTFRAKASGD
jgi:hypothetical protein